MSLKGKIICGVCGVLVAGAVSVGVWQRDNISNFFKNHIQTGADSSIEQPVKPDKPENPAYTNCGAFSGSGEELKTWQSLLDEGMIEETDNGISATTKFQVLENVTLKVPNTYTEIAPAGFKDCENLKTVELPDSITTLHFEAFKNCTNLENIRYPNSAIYVVDNVFEGCTNLNYYEDEVGKYLGNEENNFVYLAEAKYYSPNYEDESLTYKDKYYKFNENTLVVGTGSLNNCGTYFLISKNIKALNGNIGCSQYVFIPNSVQVVAYTDNFGGCGYTINANITSYVYCEFNDAKENWGDILQFQESGYLYYNSCLDAFYLASSGVQGCDIAGIEGNGTRSYGWQELLDNNYLEVDEEGTLTRGSNFSSMPQGYLRIAEGVISIGDNCFEDYFGTGNSKLFLPNSLKSIGDYAFKNSKFQMFELNNVETIGEGAFENSGSSRFFFTAENLKHIGSYAFKNCTSFRFGVVMSSKTLTIPNSVESIGTRAFDGCTQVEKIVLSNSMTTFDIESLGGLTNLKGVYIPSSITLITGASVIPDVSADINYYCETSNVENIDYFRLPSRNTTYGFTLEEFNNLKFDTIVS